MSEPLIWEITMPGKPTQQFIPLAFHKQKLNDLQAEVERLRKAGDELAEAGSLAGCSECFGLYERLEDALKAWNAAKEGKPSV